MSQPSLFDAPDTGGIPLTRTQDHATAKAAAKTVTPSISQLQRSVWEHIRLMAPVTALELEELEIFLALAPSTVRKRVSELSSRGKIIGCGEREYRSKRTGRVSRAIAWDVMPGVSL